MALPTISITGNISKIQSKFLPSGKQVVSFQLECSEKNSKGEWQNLYIKGEVWDKSAEFVTKYFKDGSAAIVSGKLYTNVYDKQDGTKAYDNKFLFPNVTFAPKDKESNNGQTNNSSNQGGYQQNQQQSQQQQQNYNAPQQQQMPQNNYQMPIDDEDPELIPF